MARHLWLILLGALALAAPALADDVSYPIGSRIGIAPPAGLVPSKNFIGYEDPDNKVALIFVTLPPAAYAEFDRSATAETFKRQGVTLEQRESFPFADGKAFLAVGSQDADGTRYRKWLLVAATDELTALVTVQIPEAARALYSDAAIRAALASLAVRATVPVEEQLSLLPFKVEDLAGFQVGGVFPGRAVVLTDVSGAGPGQVEPHIVVSVAPGAPSQTSDREAFAREVFATIPNLRDGRITGSEALRISGQPGHQLIAIGKDAATGADVTVVQWLRFGGGGFLQFLAVAPTEAWARSYPRFRAVRDGVGQR